MKDPFEEFLEDAMTGPDLELGHEMRRRLLEAAVAGESGEGPNVVRMERPADPDEQAGFDWMVGELSASRGLLARMIEDRRFFTLLDQNRRFLGTLRQVMRGEGAAAVPAAKSRRIPAAAVAAAAAVLLAAGSVFFMRPAARSLPAMAENPAAAGGGPADTQEAAITGGPKPLAGGGRSAPVEEDMRGDQPAPVIPGFAPIPEAGDLPGVAMFGGSGRSLFVEEISSEEDPAMVLSLSPGRGIPVAEEGYALLDEEPEPGLAFNDSYGSFGEGSFLAGFSRSTGPASSSLVDGDLDGTIPEPGVAIPVLIGMMALVLRRTRGGDGSGRSA